jgi:hypothetical protein
MDDIYDVLRLLVTKARGSIADAEIDKALAIIGRYQAAAPVPAATEV